MHRETGLIALPKQHPETTLHEYKELELPSSTRFIHCYTIEHIAYGHLLSGLEFIDSDNNLIARTGSTLDCRLSRHEIKPHEKLVGFRAWCLPNFRSVHYDVSFIIVPR